jgi:hypothetical protein
MEGTASQAAGKTRLGKVFRIKGRTRMYFQNFAAPVNSCPPEIGRSKRRTKKVQALGLHLFEATSPRYLYWKVAG